MDARPALHPYIVAGSCFLGMREARPAGKLGPVTISSLVLVSEELKLEPTSILLRYYMAVPQRYSVPGMCII